MEASQEKGGAKQAGIPIRLLLVGKGGARYAQACDDRFKPGYHINQFMKLFTKDAVWDGGEFGRYEGREGLTKQIEGIVERLAFSVHLFSNPDIEIEGEQARGRWYLLALLTQTDGQDMWLCGIEDDKYEKVDGQWLIAEMKLTKIFMAPYEEGWRKKFAV